jgi:1-acyl-sn-glycerol-3-phosphate acyltransferase
MPFYKCLPRKDPELMHQTSLTSVTDEEFQAAYKPTEFSTCDRLIQTLFFIIGLGWLRLIFMVVMFVIYIVLMTPVHVFSEYPKIIKIFYSYGTYVTQKMNRSIMFLCGIWYVKQIGNPDKEARAFLYNHTSLFDGPLLFALRPYTLIAMSAIKKVPIAGQITTANGCRFIDRSKQEGNSATIKSVMEDHDSLPVGVSPEGKISNGDIIFKYRTGTFLTHEKIQPVTIRYSWIFAYGGCTYNWVVDGIFEWIWLVLCTPLGAATVTFLPPITTEMQEGKSIPEVAEMCQLEVANSLGTLAIDRTSKEIFQKKVPEEAAAVAAATDPDVAVDPELPPPTVPLIDGE